MRTKNDNRNHNVFQAIFFKVTEDPHVNLKCLNHFIKWKGDFMSCHSVIHATVGPC